ncbi:MAG: insulinase family protein, partial [Muribaculaceae bacterium]|nr:insulinase family protein [Muribaculaceae bacterium]
SMMNSRLSELSNNPDTEFAGAGISIGDFFVSKTKGALDMQVIAKDTDVVPAFTQAYRELMRAAKTGFTVGEFERAKAEFLSRIEKQYEERANRQTDSYSHEYVELFINNIPAPGIEVEKEKFEQYANMLNVETVNQFFQALFSDDDNRILMAMLPESADFPVPTEQQFLDVLASVNEEELEPYKDEMREDPLIPSLPKPGKIAKKRTLDKWGATEYTLSNGMKVIVKPTTFKNNEIIVNATALGGAKSTLNPADSASVLFAPLALGSMGLNDYTNSDLQKYLQGKHVEFGIDFDNYTRSAEGSTTVKDLPVLMEYIYSFFTGFNLDEKEFAANQASMAGVLANQENNPQYIFGRDLSKTLYKSPLLQALTVADIKNADRQTIINLYRGMTANAADYTFVFVGQIDPAVFEPLMNQYLATLPSKPKKALTSYELNPAFELPQGSGINNYTTAMETPQTWMFVGTFGKLPYTAKNKIVTTVAAQVISKRVLDKVREEMGATYSIGCNGVMRRTGSDNVVFQVAAPIKPEEQTRVLEEIHTIFEECTKNVTPEEIKPAIEYLTKTQAENLEENAAWASAISATLINGVHTFLEADQILPTVTVDDVQNLIRSVLDQNNYRVILLNPAE